jgi:[ribosomal protein S5]-alanine N-acetyltransferase
MHLFRRNPEVRQDLIIDAAHLHLRPPRMEDHRAWAALRAASRVFLQPWEPTWPQDDLSLAAYKKRIRRYTEEMEDDAAYPFFIFRRDDGVLMGGLTLNNLRRGAASMATLGYWMGEKYAGKGHMTQAVDAVVKVAFEKLDLRRIEAACLPENAASLHLLSKAGFEKEGYAREYLAINGQWRDHVLLARRRQGSINALSA